MAKGKNVLTTGDVAKICNVAPRTVSKWFDSGQLKGYRIPGSKDRRIPVSELTRFMKLHNMPATAMAAGKTRVLIVDSDGASALANALQSQANYEVQTAGSNFEGGLVALKFAPHVLLVSLLAEDIDAAAICKTIRDNEELQATKVIALANRLTQSESEALRRKGFDGYISNPVDAAEVIDKIEEATAIIY